jgi:tetratricopeptide (TPR) repeat protein
MNNQRRIIIIAILIIGIAAGNIFIERQKLGLFPRIEAGLSLAQTFLELIGELRYTLASYLWVKSDLWFHEIEQYQDWKKARDLLPLFKAITVLDPNFVEAYDLGGYQLGMNLKEYRKAEEFLMEGLKHNPDSLILLLDITQLYFLQKRYAEALPCARDCLRIAFSPAHKYKNDSEAWELKFNSAFHMSHIALHLHLWDEMVRACDLRLSMKAAHGIVPNVMKMNVSNWRYLLAP